MIPADIKQQIIDDNPELTNVDLSYHGITDAELYEILPALAKNTHICSLNLSGNLFTDKGAKALAKILCQNYSLCDIDISENRLSGNCLPQFYTALAANDIIHQLCMPENIPLYLLEMHGIRQHLVGNMALASILNTYQTTWQSCQQMLVMFDGPTELCVPNQVGTPPFWSNSPRS